MVLSALGVLCLFATDADAGPRAIEPRDDVTAPTEGGPTDGGTAAPVGIPGLVLNASIEPQPVKFGAPFNLVITVQRDRGLRLDLPGALPDVETTPKTGDPVRTVEDLPAAAPLADAGPAVARVKETIRIPFLALDTQGVKTPAFVLTGPPSAGGSATVDVPSLEVKVEVEPDKMPNPNGPDAGPAPPGAVVLEAAAPSIAYAVRDARPFLALGAFSTSGLLFAIVRFFARRRKLNAPAAAQAPAPPPRPAHEVALERLEALLQGGLLKRGETGEFVERLMDEVLRDYLTARFALSAGTRTTRELVQDLLGIAVAGLDVSLVEGLLADTDLVKFAKANIPADRAHAMATRVRALIESTRAPPPSTGARP